MKPCWSRSDTQGNILGPGILMCCILGLGLEAGKSGDGVSVLPFFLPLLLPLLWIALISSRRYSVSAQGLTIRYPLGFKKHYAWEDFREIGLCKVHYAGGSAAHTLAIRCVVGKEDFGPHNAIWARENWSTQLYEVVHFRKIITVYHTPDRLAEFEAHYPCPIRDYRYLPDTLPNR